MRKRLLDILVALSIAAGIVLLSWGIIQICYKPLPAQVDQIVDDVEKIRQQRMFMYQDKDGKWKRLEPRKESEKWTIKL